MSTKILTIWCFIATFFAAMPAYSEVSRSFAEIFTSPPPPLVSLKAWEDRRLEEQTNEGLEAQWYRLKIFSINLTPIVEDKYLNDIHNFLNIIRYDVTYYKSESFQVHFATYTFLQNISDSTVGQDEVFWKSALILTDAEIGVRYSMFDLFFMGIGVGTSVYVDIRNQVVKDSIIDRVFIYTELGLMKEFIMPYSFLIFNMQMRIAGLRAPTPFVIFDHTALLNFEVFLGWRWDY